MMEVSLSVDGDLLNREVTSFGPGHYNRASTSTRRSNAITQSNQAAKLHCGNPNNLRALCGLLCPKTGDCSEGATFFGIIWSLTDFKATPIIQDVPPTLSLADG